MEYIVFKEIHNDGQVERWYYGTFNNRERANDCAMLKTEGWPIFYRVCEAGQAKAWGVKNLP